VLVIAMLLGKLNPVSLAWVLGYNFAALRTIRSEDWSAAARPLEYQAHSASRWGNSRSRRCLDFATAAITLLALLPAMAICALLVRLSSPGPILFRQHRMGRNGRGFTFYKFRSMTLDTAPDTPSHTVEGDCRITFFGAFLRRYKLDELPQFWNVLKGDMSLVGPRPKLPKHEALLMPFRPGITGEATLLFRNEEQMLAHVPRHHVDAFYEEFFKPVKAELDVAYMRDATLRSDLRLLWMTATKCLSRSTDSAMELVEIMARSMPKTLMADAVRSPRKTPIGQPTHVNPDPAPVVAD
jgi:lipopolysaccharide/colanic/teichoic acid biosynthesis glycosyltransferase